jgi:hypothetical protein
MRILFVATTIPDPKGTGWNRRVYQIQEDLKASCDADVEVFDAGHAVREQLPSRPPSIRSMLGKSGAEFLRDRLLNAPGRLSSNPLRILKSQARFSTSMLRGPALTEFEDFMTQRGPFDALVCDNALYSNAVEILSGSGVPCYYVLMHLESLNYGQRALLDVTRGSSRGLGRPTKDLLVTCGDLADEIAALSRACRVFAIARFEYEFLAATGLEAEFYPYRPVEDALRWCEEIRRARLQAPETDCFTFLSSGTLNGHNEESLSIVLRELLSTGMPPNSELVVTGMDQNELIERVPGLEGLREAHGITIAGMVTNQQFEKLLISASALVIPRYCGFGALTRFADAAASGIPVLTNVPESISGLNAQQAHVVEESRGWRDVMDAFAQSNARLSSFPSDESRASQFTSPLAQIRIDHMKNLQRNPR